MSIAVARAAADYPKFHFTATLADSTLKFFQPNDDIINVFSLRRSIAFQNSAIVPAGATFKEALRWGAEIFHALKEIQRTWT
ncbi:MAG: hypothetical protein ACLS36_02900 [Streptococcus sp.]